MILEGRQKQLGEGINQRQDDLQSRLDALERQGDAEKLAFDGLQERLRTLETSQSDTMARLEEAYAELAQVQAGLGEAQAARDAIQAVMEALEGTQDAGQVDVEAVRAEVQAVRAEVQSLRANLEALGTDLEALQTSLASTQSAFGSTQDDLVAIESGVDDLSDLVNEYRLDVVAVNEALSGDKSPTVLLQELQLVKAMQLLTRARLVLVQNNLGLAQFDIQAGRRILVDLQSEVPAYQSEQLARAIARLDTALGYLPDAPVAAVDELEGAWQLLIAGLPAEPSAVPTAEATPEATPTPETTPTPAATPTPTG